MVSAPQAPFRLTQIIQAPWNAACALHLGAKLSPMELDFLFDEIEAGNVQLWQVYNLNETGNTHIATVCTQIETMYDRTKHLVVIHGGGQFVESLPQIHDFLYQEAKNQGCTMFRAILSRKGVARILKRQYGCRDYEYLVSKEVR